MRTVGRLIPARARGSKGLNDNVWRGPKRVAGAGLPDRRTWRLTPRAAGIHVEFRWH
ncbi:hypothetical protein CBM2586_A10019 [Cupriavidus phytorum]|uniref:Uncharacterized protein n=1 Tax=Cupriavidus taiwanensis TaxID=164546 RepID=A0A375B8W0_9BURK|nr:hypothetical protein CBM2586_A10019 [Cupriavidus taiwanensis]